MARSARWAAAWALCLALGACQASTDVVAWSYGDYDPDPNHRPYILQIEGDISLADPSMFFWQGTTYVFSTGARGSGLDLRTSKDLKNFELVDQPVLSPNPGWIAPFLPDVTNLWSPYVLAWDGTIHLYYAASWFGVPRACIGHATTGSLEEPFVDDAEPLICSNLTDPFNTEPYVAIDPAVIVDGAGHPWMVFGSGGNGINILALDHHGRRFDPTGSPHVVAARTSGELEAIQAASLYHWRDHYYLFVSYEWSPNHILRVGRSQSVGGPYVDRDGIPMTEGGGTLVLQGNDTFKGPGSNMVFDDGKQRLNVYHAYNATDDIRLRIAQLFFDQDGWPVSAGP